MRGEELSSDYYTYLVCVVGGCEEIGGLCLLLCICKQSISCLFLLWSSSQIEYK